jgi:Fic family protein
LHRPFVQIGRLTAADLAGYRQRPVFLRGSMYVPPPPGLAVIDSMEAFFAALREEPDAAVRAVLGHFVFVYIHPFIDGNGRIGRFLMNTMLASGGYPWTILRVTRRGEYMAALERASMDRDIGAFADFVVEEMEVNWTAELAQTERTVRKRAR